MRYCSFCGRSEDEVSVMVNGTNGCVCDECASHISTIINEKKELVHKHTMNGVMKPVEIKKFLDQYVIGQDKCKERIAVAVYNHYKRISDKNITDDVEIAKSNVLILGDTGSGKSLIAESIARMLDVPFAIADATVLTQAGYVGEDVESILSKLLQAADYNVERAERGIIFIDEIDKIARKGDNPSITRDVSGEGVQQGLLKLLEGSIINVPPQGGRKHPDQKFIQVNTKNILFICAGAFDGIESKISARLNKHSVGFGATEERANNINKKEKHILSKVTVQDIKKFGLIPEIIGRLPVITYTETLDKEALVKILTEPKNAIIKQYVKLLEMDGIKLTFDNEVLDYIADKAIKNKIGARALRGIVEDLMSNAMFTLPTSGKTDFNVTIDYAKEKLEEAA